MLKYIQDTYFLIERGKKWLNTYYFDVVLKIRFISWHVRVLKIANAKYYSFEVDIVKISHAMSQKIHNLQQISVEIKSIVKNVIHFLSLQ